MDPNCKNLNTIEQLQLKDDSFKLKKNDRVIAEANNYHFIVKHNEGVALQSTLTVYVNVYYIDVELYLPVVYYMFKHSSNILCFTEFTIKKTDLPHLKKEALKKVKDIPNVEYKTYVVIDENTIMVYLELDTITDYLGDIDKQDYILVTSTEIKDNKSIFNKYTFCDKIIDYYEKEKYYALKRKNGVIPLPVVEYYNSDVDNLKVDEKTGYISLQNKKEKDYILRVCLVFTERKTVSSIEDIEDIISTAYYIDDTHYLVVPSNRLCKILSIKK